MWANKGLGLQVQDAQGDSSFVYGPRYRHYVGVGGFLWNIGFNILIPVSTAPENTDLRRFDFQGALFSSTWLLDGIFQRYQGFFINPAGRGSLEQAPERLNENLLIRKAKVSFTYTPGGENISLRAPFNAGDRQRKSGGAFMLSGGFSSLLIREEGGILPAALLTEDTPPLTYASMNTVTSTLGYTHTLTYKKFFAHLYAQAGFGFQYRNYRYPDSQQSFAVSPIYAGRASVGYDNGDFYVSLYGIADYATFTLEQWTFHEITTQLRVSVGLRFPEPGFIRSIKPGFIEKLQNSPSIPLPSIFG